jgi:hypothetical protein
MILLQILMGPQTDGSNVLMHPSHLRETTTKHQYPWISKYIRRGNWRNSNARPWGSYGSLGTIIREIRCDCSSEQSAHAWVEHAPMGLDDPREESWGHFVLRPARRPDGALKASITSATRRRDAGSVFSNRPKASCKSGPSLRTGVRPHISSSESPNALAMRKAASTDGTNSPRSKRGM